MRERERERSDSSSKQYFMRFCQAAKIAKLWNYPSASIKRYFWDFASTVYVVVSKDLLQQDVVGKRVFWRQKTSCFEGNINSSFPIKIHQFS